MITTEIMGGLGNQLFQIFNLLSYSLTYKIPFYFENKPTTRKDRPHYWNNFLTPLKPFLRIAFNKNNIPIIVFSIHSNILDVLENKIQYTKVIIS